MGFTPYIFVFLGGGTGACARLCCSKFCADYFASLTKSGFPIGTLMVNLVGAFLIGLIGELLALKFNMNEAARYALITGFLGGFTTFSAFSLETYLMINRHDYGMSFSYITASIFGTVLLVFAAVYIVRALV